MANNELAYKGYKGSIEVSIEDDCLHGRILFIDDIVTYEAETVKEIAAAFESSVDRYVAYCAEAGKEPNKPYSGTLNVRVGPSRHRAMAQRAYRENVSLNELFCRAADLFLADKTASVAGTKAAVSSVANPVHTFVKTGTVIAAQMEQLAASFPDIAAPGDSRVFQISAETTLEVH